jgi:hypothetical protein
MATPDIATFVSLESPPNERYLAVFYATDHKGRRVRLPMVFAGPDEDDLRARAGRWWQEESAKEAQRKARAAERISPRRKITVVGEVA